MYNYQNTKFLHKIQTYIESKIESGYVLGSTIKDGAVSIFKGIPYAAPPECRMRWKAHQNPRHGLESAKAHNFSGQVMTMDIRPVLKFKAPVNHQALLTAADEALRLFPEFSVQPVLKGSRVFYEENHNHIALLQSGTRYDFGTSDMNGYLFCFQADPAKENEVIFSVYHGLSDWNGISRFFKTIICRYAVHVKGLPDDYFSGVIRSKAPEKNEWLNEANLNPYEFYARQDAVPSYKPEMPSDVFTLPEEDYSFDSPASRHIRITLSVSQFLKAAKSHNSSFVPYLLYLASNAIREAYSTDKNIFLGLPADLRNVFGADTIVNFSESIFLPSSLQEHSAPAEEQCRRFREMITLQKQPENYEAILYDKSRRIRSYEAAPEGIFAKSRELTTQTSELAKSITTGITYPGIMDMPEGADDLLENIIMDSPFGVSFLQITTYRDEMSITSVQRYDGGKIVKSICRKLTSAGFDAKIADNRLIAYNILNLERLKRV